MKIDTDSWGEFQVGSLFEVSAPEPRAKLKYAQGDVPFVASGEFNNGVSDYLEPLDDEDYEAGNCITVSPLGGTAFYQKDPFLGRGGGGSSISILRSPVLTENIALFVCTVIRKAGSLFGYTDHLSKSKLRKLVIKLPQTSTGEPDWDCMNECITVFRDQAQRRVVKLDRVAAALNEPF